jgi:predicted nucleotidyltransferase
MIDKIMLRFMPAYKLKAFPVPPGLAWLARPLQSCAGILAVNWVMQGMRGMGRRELSFRLLLEAGAALLLAAALTLAGIAVESANIIGALAAHTLNWLLNGQIWVCARYCRLYRGRVIRLQLAMADLVVELPQRLWLDEAALIGSAADGRQQERSDIDLRLVFPAGPGGWLRTNMLLLRLRSRAFLRMVPLDVYAHDRTDDLRRSDPADSVRLLIDRHGRLRRLLADRRLVG